MISKAKNIIKRILIPNKSKKYIRYLKRHCIEIGENCHFFEPESTCVDIQRPHMLHIGNLVYFTAGVTVLAHDYSRVVLANCDEYGNVGEAKLTWIGDNVFIGTNSIILMGTHIGDNTIVGAGSVCSGFYPDNVIIAGNPAKVVCTLDDFYKKRKAREIDSAKLFASQYYRHYGKLPTVSQMTDAFSWLYLPHNESTLDEYKRLLNLNNDRKREAFLSTKSQFDSYLDFVSSIEGKTE